MLILRFDQNGYNCIIRMILVNKKNWHGRWRAICIPVFQVQLISLTSSALKLHKVHTTLGLAGDNLIHE